MNFKMRVVAQQQVGVFVKNIFERTRIGSVDIQSNEVFVTVAMEEGGQIGRLALIYAGIFLRRIQILNDRLRSFITAALADKIGNRRKDADGQFAVFSKAQHAIERFVQFVSALVKRHRRLYDHTGRVMGDAMQKGSHMSMVEDCLRNVQ